MFANEITFDVSIYKNGDNYYFNSNFVEDCVKNIVEIKQTQTYIDLIEYVELACQAAESAYNDAINNGANEAQDKLEVECFGQPISCLTTSFLSRLFNEFGSVCVVGEEYPEAVQHYNTSLKYNNDNNLSLQNLADVLFTLEKFEDAITKCDELLTKDENNIPTTYLKALSFVRLEKFGDALPLFIKTAELDESSIGANFWAGEFSRITHDYKTARKYFKRASELSNYTHADCMKGYAISELMLDGGDLEKCIELCDMVLRTDALKQVKMYEIKGNAYIKQGDIAKGALAHAKLISFDANAIPITVEIAKSIKDEHGYDKMMEYINNAVMLSSESLNAFDELISSK